MMNFTKVMELTNSMSLKKFKETSQRYSHNIQTKKDIVDAIRFFTNDYNANVVEEILREEEQDNQYLKDIYEQENIGYQLSLESYASAMREAIDVLDDLLDSYVYTNKRLNRQNIIDNVKIARSLLFNQL